jgi:hypothetical protein
MNRLWHAAIAALVAFALISATVMVVDNGASLVNMYSYFTIQSNILMMIGAALVAIRPDRGGTAFEVIRLAGLVAITVTGIVFSTVLAGAIELEGLEWWNDKIFHYVVPAMAVIGYLVFRPRTLLHRGAYLFLVWPIAWLAYTLIRAGAADPRFRGENGTTMDVPYDFLSVDLQSAGSVALASLIVLALALGLAWCYLKLSQRSAVETALARPLDQPPAGRVASSLCERRIETRKPGGSGG